MDKTEHKHKPKQYSTLTQAQKDKASAPAHDTVDALNAWPSDVSERAALIGDATALANNIDKVPVAPPVTTGNVRYPDSDLVLTEKEQLFSDSKTQWGTGAFGGWQQQDPWDLTMRPGMYVYCSNAPMRFETIGGDWFDKDGVKNGPAAFATVKISDLGSKVAQWIESEDVAALAQKFADGVLPNWGFAFRNNDKSIAVCDSLYTTNPDFRPCLVVTVGSDPPVACYPERFISMYGANLTTMAQTPTFQFAPYWLTYAYVDLSQFKGKTISKAVWRFHSSDQYGNTVGLIVRVRNHAYDDNAPPIEYGIAKDFPEDVNIEHDSHILAVIRPEPTMKFDETSWMGWGPGQKYGKGANNAQFAVIDDPQQMLLARYPVMRCTMYAGGLQGVLERHSQLYEGRGYNAIRTVPKPPKKIFWRYVARFNDGRFGEAPWNPAPFGGKLPGVNGRWRQLGPSYVNAQGFPPALVLSVPGCGLGNSGSTQSGLNGTGSARGNFDQYDPKSPLAAVAGFGFADCYNAHISGPYGNNQMWDLRTGGHARKGEFVCIEGCAWVNTVTHPEAMPVRLASIVNNNDGTATATTYAPITDKRWFTQDALWSIGGNIQNTEAATGGNYSYFNRDGVPITPIDDSHFKYPLKPGAKAASVGFPANNGLTNVWLMAVAGQGNLDGGLRGYVNGRCVCDIPNLVWHHSEFLPDCVTPIGWETVWWCLYYGGGQLPVLNASMDLAAMVVSTEYIGPFMRKAA